MQKEPDTILFFDGNCGFCNQTVQFILRHEKNKNIYFSPLQSIFAAEQFKAFNYHNDFSSIVVIRKGKLYTRSAAIQIILADLKSPYSLLPCIIKFLPRVLSNFVYELISKNRHRISKVTSCAVLDPIDRERFIY